MSKDVIDAVLGIAPGSRLDGIRRGRELIRDYTQTSYEAALNPADAGRLPLSLRAALGARMARLHGRGELAAHYDAVLAARNPSEAERIAADPGRHGADDDRMRAILRHVDLVTLTPKDATRADIQALRDQGLTDPQIVTLAGLIAFVNYQILVVAGLSMLRDY